MSRRAIRQLAKLVGEDMMRGAPSPAALAAGPLIAQSGTTPELVALLVAEARKPRPAPRAVEAYGFLLEGALSELSVAVNGGGAVPREQLAKARGAVETALAANRLPPTALMLIARAFSLAGLDPGATLKAAMAAGIGQRDATVKAWADPGEATSRFARIAEAMGHDPFAIHAEISASSAAFPIEHRAALAAEFAMSAIPSARHAALGFLLDTDPAPGVAALEGLLAHARREPASSRLVERLVRIRPWLPAARRAGVDAAIRDLRATALAPEPEPPVTVVRRLASFHDGSGAQSMFALTRAGHRFAVAAVLTKEAMGVVDAIVRTDLPRREAEHLLAQTTAATGAVEVSADFLAMRLAHALARNVARQSPPPFGLLQLCETIGLGVIQPAEWSPLELAERLLAGLPSDRTGPDATAAAHRQAAHWPAKFELISSWFEAGEAVEALLRPVSTRRKRVEAVLTRHLPGRRLVWAERCAWMAATLREAAAVHGDAWLAFALVARDLAAGQPPPDAPVFKMIAEATVDAFDRDVGETHRPGRA